MEQRSITCKRCCAIGWIEATPLGKQNWQTCVCKKCGRKNYIFTRKWGKAVEF